ncbi:MAG: DUF4276 family protein [Bacteroidales bacterium]|nr:DUF4276 family protein [Bacteroidales bacterium]MCF8338925.1 DUF4276 family protein [Bacteroidales bacterium]
MIDIVVAILTEGPTDERFLPTIVKRSIEDILIELGDKQYDVHDPHIIPKKGHNFSEQVYNAAWQANGYHFLAVHSDADDPDRNRVWEDKINPAFQIVRDRSEELCKDLLAVIPVQMTEAWMLADREALQEEIGYDISIPRYANIERIADPKADLKRILSQSQSSESRRRRKLEIADIYQPLASNVHLEKLNHLPSYQKFRTELIELLQKLHFIN